MTKCLSHTSKRANWTLSMRQPIFYDMMANEKSRKGISEIEGKVAEGSDEQMKREACDIDGQTDRSKWAGAHESKRSTLKRPLVESQIVKSFHCCSTKRGSLRASTSTVLKNVPFFRRKIAASDACPGRTAPRKPERPIPGFRSAPGNRRACRRHSNRRPLLRLRERRNSSGRARRQVDGRKKPQPVLYPEQRLPISQAWLTRHTSIHRNAAVYLIFFR